MADDAGAPRRHDGRIVIPAVRSLPRLPFRRSGPVELWPFAAAYVAYDGPRWIITAPPRLARRTRPVPAAAATA